MNAANRLLECADCGTMWSQRVAPITGCARCRGQLIPVALSPRELEAEIVDLRREHMQTRRAFLSLLGKLNDLEVVAPRGLRDVLRLLDDVPAHDVASITTPKG